MQSGRASMTAYRVALRRAAHQAFDRPLILDDPLALRILGPDVQRELRERREARQGRLGRAMRAFFVVRSRFAEDALDDAIARGVRQYVVLGAGLDTSCYRRPAGEELRMFEVDHPATQAWKRECLQHAGIAVPRNLSFVPVDFERQSLAEELRTAGLDGDQPVFFSWLGVTLYLTSNALTATLRFIASLPPETTVVFDYVVDSSELGWIRRFIRWLLVRGLAKAGEPMRTSFKPSNLETKLRALGFAQVENPGPEELNARYCKGRSDGMQVGRIARIAMATV